jgi:hypothetical protein
VGGPVVPFDDVEAFLNDVPETLRYQVKTVNGES